MANINSTSNFIFGASERELLTLSISEIIDGLLADYQSFSTGNLPGVNIPDRMVEPRMAHSCILYAEGLRLARTHLELAKKLILASLFDITEQAEEWLANADKHHTNARAIDWLKANNEADLLTKVLKAIQDFEDYKAEERKKEEKKFQ